MACLRLAIAFAAAFLLSEGPLMAQQASAPSPHNNASTDAAQPAPGAASAPSISPARRDGLASSSATDETPPFAGANSFTESQAQDRIAKSGYNNVKGLQQDRQGVWRGKAEKAGQEVNVALDYRGNVVQQ